MAKKTPTKSDPAFLAALAQVAPALAAWRRRRKHREPIPEDLWQKMVLLARRYGLSPIAQALRVNYNGLKRRLGSAPSRPTRGLGTVVPRFVEMPLPAWPGGPQWVIELEDRGGCKLTLRLPANESAAALALAKGLWEQRA